MEGYRRERRRRGGLFVFVHDKRNRTRCPAPSDRQAKKEKKSQGLIRPLVKAAGWRVMMYDVSSTWIILVKLRAQSWSSPRFEGIAVQLAERLRLTLFPCHLPLSLFLPSYFPRTYAGRSLLNVTFFLSLLFPLPCPNPALSPGSSPPTPSLSFRSWPATRRTQSWPQFKTPGLDLSSSSARMFPRQ